MEEKRNLILAIVLSGLVLVGWQYFFPMPQGPAPEAAPRQEIAVGASPQAQADTQVTLGGQQQPVFNDDTAPKVQIDTPDSIGSINLRGAKIDRLALVDYKETLDADSAIISLLKGGVHSYYASYGWTGKGVTLPDNKTVWTADRDVLSVDQPVRLSWTSPEGVTFLQDISIEDRFLLSVKQSVVNGSTRSLALAPYGLISRGGTPETSGFYILHEGLIGVLGDSLNEIDYDTLLEDKRQRFNSDNGWLGITDKYWLVAQIPAQGQNFNAAFSAQQSNLEPRYQTDFVTDVQNVAAGETVSYSSHLFIGAKETNLLDRYRDERGFHQFDLAVDFGVMYFITKPIFYMLDYLFEILGNFGLAILALTVGIKLLFFPLSNKSYVSMSKMKLLQPKMVELKERYGDDRQKLNTEMMGLYKREKVNPLAGCLPILMQIPVFFALYKVLFVSIEMRHAPFFGWISDLSAPDPLGVLTLFGLIDWQVPAILAIVNIGLWPLIMGLTMWGQQKLNPAPADPMQAKIFALMPIFFTFLLATFPAGLVIYWAWNNILTISQQWIIMRRLAKKSEQA